MLQKGTQTWATTFKVERKKKSVPYDENICSTNIFEHILSPD